MRSRRMLEKISRTGGIPYGEYLSLKGAVSKIRTQACTYLFCHLGHVLAVALALEGMPILEPCGSIDLMRAGRCA